MNLGEVMQEIADRLDTIDGLHVYAYPPGSVTPPAAVVGFPDSLTFDVTGRRGKDRMSLPVVVVVGRPTDRSTRDRLAQYCDGSGAASVKAAVEAGTPASFGSVRVVDAEFDVVTIGGQDYAAALFTLDIGGAGA